MLGDRALTHDHIASTQWHDFLKANSHNVRVSVLGVKPRTQAETLGWPSSIHIVGADLHAIGMHMIATMSLVICQPCSPRQLGNPAFDVLLGTSVLGMALGNPLWAAWGTQANLSMLRGTLGRCRTLSNSSIANEVQSGLLATTPCPGQYAVVCSCVVVQTYSNVLPEGLMYPANMLLSPKSPYVSDSNPCVSDCTKAFPVCCLLLNNVPSLGQPRHLDV